MATLLQRQFSNRAYWEKREREAREKYLKDEAQQLAEIDKIYRDMMLWADDEINKFYGKYATLEGIDIIEAKKRVAKEDVEAFQEQAKKYVQQAQRDRSPNSPAFSDRANQELRLYNATMKINRLELLKAQIGLHQVGDFQELENYMEDELTQRAIEEYTRQAGILGNTLPTDIEERAKAIVNASFYNATFSDRIWAHCENLRNSIAIELQKGLIAGIGSRQMASNLRKIYNVSVSDAHRLMVTELRRVQTDVAMDSYKQNGFTQYMYMAVNPNACEICRSLNNKIYNVQGAEVGNYEHPLPPMHPRCHCTTAPHVDEAGYEAWLNFLESGGTTEQWDSMTPAQRTSWNTPQPTTKVSSNEPADEYKEIDIDEFKKLKGKITKDERAIIYGSTRLDGYINSSNARVNINAPLRSGKQPQGQYKTIADTLQSVIEKNTLPENLKLTRYVSTDALQGMFGIPPVKVGMSDSLDNAYKKMTDALSQRTTNTYIEKAFLSTSAVESNNVMSDKPVRINILANKGTNAYISTNNKESEIIFGHGTTLELIDIYLDTDVAPWQYVANCRLKQ